MHEWRASDIMLSSLTFFLMKLFVFGVREIVVCVLIIADFAGGIEAEQRAD